MDHETKSSMVAGGLVLEQQIEEAIGRQVNVIASAFELMVVLSPSTALEILNQLNEQINEESVDKMLKQRQEYFDKLKERVS